MSIYVCEFIVIAVVVVVAHANGHYVSISRTGRVVRARAHAPNMERSEVGRTC